jgi:hypothetical protein
VATEMSGSPRVDCGLRVSEEEWRAVLAIAEELAEKVSGLSHRLAAVEEQLKSGDRQVPARPRPSAR